MEAVEEAVVHIKMELIYQMSPVNLKIQIGSHYQTIQEKVSLRTWYSQMFWQIKRGAPPAPSVLKRITKIGSSLRSPMVLKTQYKMNMDWKE